jgi:hypothetical protein
MSFLAVPNLNLHVGEDSGTTEEGTHGDGSSGHGTSIIVVTVASGGSASGAEGRVDGRGEASKLGSESLRASARSVLELGLDGGLAGVGLGSDGADDAADGRGTGLNGGGSLVNTLGEGSGGILESSGGSTLSTSGSGGSVTNHASSGSGDVVDDVLNTRGKVGGDAVDNVVNDIAGRVAVVVLGKSQEGEESEDSGELHDDGCGAVGGWVGRKCLWLKLVWRRKMLMENGKEREEEESR